MFNLIKQLLMFRVGQKAASGLVRSVGFGSLATVAGLVGGYHYMRRHSR